MGLGDIRQGEGEFGHSRFEGVVSQAFRGSQEPDKIRACSSKGGSVMQGSWGNVYHVHRVRRAMMCLLFWF